MSASPLTAGEPVDEVSNRRNGEFEPETKSAAVGVTAIEGHRPGEPSE
jgi:hypothetical protein